MTINKEIKIYLDNLEQGEEFYYKNILYIVMSNDGDFIEAYDFNNPEKIDYLDYIDLFDDMIINKLETDANNI